MTWLNLEMPDGRAEAWLATAEHGEARRGVLLFMDGLGLREEIRAIADHIASWGYTVLAPNVFYRSGSTAETTPGVDLRAPGASDAFFADVRPRLATLTSERFLDDLPRYLDALDEAMGAEAGSYASVGYCMGVSLAMRAAGFSPDQVLSVAGFHGGRLVTEEPDSPHLCLPGTKVRLLMRHGDGDHLMTPSHMAELEATCEGAGLELSQAVYPGAAHGYAMSDTPTYHPAARRRHFDELERFLAAG